MLRPAIASSIPEVQAIFTAAWNMLKEFYNLKQDGTQEDWDEMLRRYGAVSQMGTSPETKMLSGELAQSVIHFIEYRSKIRE